MENVIVVIIVVLAVVYLLRSFFRSSRKDAPSCGCGCSGCRSETVCPPEGKDAGRAQSQDPHAT